MASWNWREDQPEIYSVSFASFRFSEILIYDLQRKSN